jgi:BRCT domain type II-containing protein
MQLTLKVTFADDTQHIVTTNLMTIVAWERKYKRKASQISDGIGIEDLSYMAYEASRSANITVPALLDEYIKSLKNLEVVDQESPKVDAVHTATD